MAESGGVQMMVLPVADEAQIAMGMKELPGVSVVFGVPGGHMPSATATQPAKKSAWWSPWTFEDCKDPQPLPNIHTIDYKSAAKCRHVGQV